jgi:MerR family mercuric resistance operon transcriptional regulator
MPTRAFTIRKLADAADVGVETVRYYQQRGLLAAPERADGGFREYSENDVLRLRFIKRAQALGFSLEDITELVSLSATHDQVRVRQITRDRVLEIRERIADLQSMAHALEGLADCCVNAPAASTCPIIEALTANQAARMVTANAVEPSEQHSPGVRRRQSRGRAESAAA